MERLIVHRRGSRAGGDRESYEGDRAAFHFIAPTNFSNK